jgi:gluconolactonase
MYGAPPVVATEIFAKFPDELLVRPKHRSLLEGPSFDRAGNLYGVNVRHGQIVKITPDAKFSVVAQYDGEPNGLKIHRDGRIFVADHKQGIVLVDPDAGTVTPFVAGPPEGRFHGLNDLVFDSTGQLYFTDQGETGLHDPTGRLWRVRVDGTLECILDCIPSPNGLITAPDERIIYLAVTRANAIWRVPIRHNSRPGRVGTFIQMSGGVGPDGMAQDAAGNILVAHPGMGSVWMFDPDGRLLAEIRSCAGKMTTNIAFGGPDNRTLYIMEAASGSVLMARLDIPGKPMFSHS